MTDDMQARWRERARRGQCQYVLTLDQDDAESPPLRAEVTTFDAWAEQYARVTEERAEQMDLLVRRGVIIRQVDRVRVTGRDEIVLRRRLRQVMDGRPVRRSRGTAEPVRELRYLLGGLWPWGTCPSLSGQYGVGKTRLLANLLRALVDPTCPFLGAYGPSTLTADELGLGIVVLNAETSPAEFEAELRRAGLEFDSIEGRWGVERLDLPSPEVGFAVTVVHLADEGGPQVFDVTDRDKFDHWVERLTECDECENPFEDFAPVVLVVDTMTAVLDGAGRYAQFIPAFMRLLLVTGIPNGLVVGHAYQTTDRLLGDPDAMSRQDGRWSYSSSDPENPEASRWWKARPRAVTPATPSTRVVIGPDGLLCLAGHEPAAAAVTSGSEQDGASEVEAAEERPDPAWTAEVRAALREAGSAGALQTALTGRGGYGPPRKEALLRLVDLGEAVCRPEPNPRGGRPGTRYWSIEHDPARLAVTPESS